MTRIGVIRSAKGEINAVFLEPNSDEVAELQALADESGHALTFHKFRPWKWVREQLKGAAK